MVSQEPHASTDAPPADRTSQFSEVRILVAVLCLLAIEFLGLILSASPYPVAIIGAFMLVEAGILATHFRALKVQVVLVVCAGLAACVIAGYELWTTWDYSRQYPVTRKPEWSEYFFITKLYLEIFVLAVFIACYRKFLKILRWIQDGSFNS